MWIINKLYYIPFICSLRGYGCVLLEIQLEYFRVTVIDLLQEKIKMEIFWFKNYKIFIYTI